MSEKRFTVDSADFGAVLKADSKRAAKAIARGLYKGALIGEAIVAEATPVDRGNARAAWQVYRTPDGAVLDNDAPHILFLEEGTRPHRPPLLPIVQWLSRKEGRGTNITDISQADADIRFRAMRIADSIAEKGTKAHHMVQRNLPRLAGTARLMVEVELRNAAQGKK